MRLKYKACVSFACSTFVEVRRARILSHASSLAYSTLLTIVPFFIVIFSILSHFSVFKEVYQQLNALLIDNLAYHFATEIESNIAVFLQHVNELSTLSVLSLFIVVVLLLFNITKAFNHIWSAQGRFRSSISFFFHMIILFISPIVLAILLLAYPYFSFLQVWLAHESYLTWLLPLWSGLPSVAGVVCFSLLNFYLPNASVRLVAAVIAGVFTEVAFVVARVLFQFYLIHFDSNKLIYGSLATIPLFLVWLFVAWCIVLTGAVLCRQLTRDTGGVGSS